MKKLRKKKRRKNKRRKKKPENCEDVCRVPRP
jgi:hypothetical protein